MTLPPPPTFTSVAHYGTGLADARLWSPYVREVLRRHRRLEARGDLGAGFVGTFPTFLVGGLVVKLFGYFEGWRTCFETELAMHRLLLGHPRVPAPALVAHGQLYDGREPWPYLVTSRLRGRAWRDVRLPATVGTRLAGRLGEIVRQVHELPVPGAPVFSADWTRDHRAGCVDRQSAWGTLAPHLVEQIPDFLPDPVPERTLVHADLTEDHLFLDGSDLVGIIDWGDAFATDRYYELSALHLGAFGADTALLRAFLTGYGWPVDDTFVRRAMGAALLHRFDVFGALSATARRSTTLDDVAAALWDVR